MTKYFMCSVTMWWSPQLSQCHHLTTTMDDDSTRHNDDDDNKDDNDNKNDNDNKDKDNDNDNNKYNEVGQQGLETRWAPATGMFFSLYPMIY